MHDDYRGVTRRDLHEFYGHLHPEETIKNTIWPRFRELGSQPPAISAEPGECVALCGPTGTGKTTIAWQLWALWAAAEPFNCAFPQFFATTDLLEDIRRSFGGKPFELRPEKLLVLDDLGVERPTEWVLEQLYRIIDTRYRALGRLIITTNLTPSALTERLGDRIVSRLVQMCRWVNIDGSDRRLS